MNIASIRESVNEISSNASTVRDEDIIEGYLATLEELEEDLEIATEDMESDAEYQDIMVLIEETTNILEEKLDNLFIEDDNEY